MMLIVRTAKSLVGYGPLRTRMLLLMMMVVVMMMMMMMMNGVSSLG